MNKLQIKGEQNKQKGQQKQKEACATNPQSDTCQVGKEEELTGKLQKKLGKGDDEILKMMEEED